MKKLMIAALALAGALNAHAAEKHILDGVDISAAVEMYQKQIHTVTKPFYVYNWSPNAHQGDSDKLVAFAQNAAEAYWYSLGDQGKAKDNMFGAGLYAAVDPVVSYSYGQGGTGWRVIEFQMPVGLRLLDMNDAVLAEGDQREAGLKVVQQFDCPADGTVGVMLAQGAVGVSEKCRRLIREIFGQILNIDAIAYGYADTRFSFCTDNQFLSAKAFVMTNGEWMTPGNTKFFTAQSTKDEEARIRLQTTFLEAKFQRIDVSKDMVVLLKNYVKAHPSDEYGGSKTICIGNLCTLHAIFCASVYSTCNTVPIMVVPRVGGPTLTNAESMATLYMSLLWPDLEGKPKMNTVRKWIKENKFGCAGTSPLDGGPQ